VPIGSKAIDLGSGKGGAVITLSQFRFDEVVGLEISGELVRVARSNSTRLGLRNVRFVCADVRLFTEFDDFSHIYMYNPFPCDILKEALAHLRESLVRKPRSLILIYKNPTCHSTIVDSGLFPANREFSFPNCHHPFYVYFTERLAGSSGIP
jgi:tRNA A58 N-methylase Trm61